MTGRVLGFVSGLVLAAVLAAPAGAIEPPASLSGFLCRTASNPLNRVVSVTATMRPVSDTASMKLRFVLLERTPGRMFHAVRGGDLGVWHHAPSEIWVVKKPVANLPAPAVYRLRVSFVWLDSSGSVISAQTLLGPACRQPG